MPTPETKRVLITVKAYPNPSKKYVETVCCAGIDKDTLQWIRLYPIPFRDLDNSQKFQKYSIIQVRCWKSKEDSRTESYKVDSDSIQKLLFLDTKKDKWQARKDIVLQTVSPSFCDILGDTNNNKSLGMFKPCDVQFSWEKAQLEDETKRQAVYAQLSFLDKAKNPIEQIPFDFYYQFKCQNVPNCPGHKLPIVDWEIKQSYRKWRSLYGSEDELLQKIKQRWLNEMCAQEKDVYFYVGNMNRFHDQFMILGVFYPPK
jgi:hypothetical protein